MQVRDFVKDRIATQDNAAFLLTTFRNLKYEVKLHSLPFYMLELICEQTEERFGNRPRVGFGWGAASSHQPTEAPAT
jgi:hypothetical protein